MSLLAFALLGCCSFATAGSPSLLLNELKVNPPGTNDSPAEYIELLGTAGAALTNVHLLVLSGAGEPGLVTYHLDLSGASVGQNGLVLVAAPNHRFVLPSSTTVVADPALAAIGGALDNKACSFMLVYAATQFSVGQDLDKGNNGVPEGIPSDAIVLDSLSLREEGKNSEDYSAAVLSLKKAVPDAATRIPGNYQASSRAAWVCGQLEGPESDSGRYSYSVERFAAPPGTVLTPGASNLIAPRFGSIIPVSGVIGATDNPPVSLSVTGLQAQPFFQLWAQSANTQVVADAGLSLSVVSSNGWRLNLDPQGVGYSDITVFASDGVLTGRVEFPYAASAPGVNGGAWHFGASDGSTALALDSDYMVVGDDEGQVLRLYPRNVSGFALGSFDFTSELGLPDIESGMPREVDIEASTRVGDRLFWIGSHGHSVFGEARTNRTRIFVTDLVRTNPTPTLNYVGRYDYFKVDLIDWDNRNVHGKGARYYGIEASDADGVPPKAPDGSGLAIEGLAMMPGNTNGAYVAFRAPIVPATNRTSALIVPVLNFATVAAASGPPGSCVFGPPIELDLYGRGIRSLEGGTNGYLLIAGPAGVAPTSYPNDFRLYTWSGLPEDKPRLRSTELIGLNPEGIVDLPSSPWVPDSRIQLISDSGTSVFYGDDVPAKALTQPGFKKFRSDWVNLGKPVMPPPVIVSTELIPPGTLRIHWRALAGATYQVLSSDDPSSGRWQAEPVVAQATSQYASKDLPIEASDRFYRLIILTEP